MIRFTTRLTQAIALDGLHLLGRGIGSVLAGMEATLTREAGRRNVLDMTTGEAQAAAEAGTLTYRQVLDLAGVEKRVRA